MDCLQQKADVCPSVDLLLQVKKNTSCLSVVVVVVVVACCCFCWFVVVVIVFGVFVFLPLYTSFKFDQNCKPAYFDIPLHNTVVVNTAFVKLLHGTFLFGQKCQNRFQFHLTTFCPLTKQKLHFCFCPQHTTHPPPLAPLYAHTHTHTHTHTYAHTHTHTHTHTHIYQPTKKSSNRNRSTPKGDAENYLPAPKFMVRIEIIPPLLTDTVMRTGAEVVCSGEENLFARKRLLFE